MVVRFDSCLGGWLVGHAEIGVKKICLKPSTCFYFSLLGLYICLIKLQNYLHCVENILFYFRFDEKIELALNILQPQVKVLSQKLIAEIDKTSSKRN